MKQATGYGFIHGLRQPGVELTLEIGQRMADLIEPLDPLLTESLDVNLVPIEYVSAAAIDTSLHTYSKAAWRVMLLAQSLLRAANVPVFDPGRLVAASVSARNPTSQLMQIAVPWIDGMPIRYLYSAYRAALQTIATLLEQSDKEGLIGKVQDRLHSEFVLKVRAATPGGESTVPLLHNAYHRGVPFRHLTAGVYSLCWGEHLRLVDRSSTDADAAIGSKLCKNKFHTASVLRSAGLPAPIHLLVQTEEQALKAAEQLGWPLVVKPLDRERGEGVIVDVHDRSRLVLAYREAAAFSKSILIEQQVPGVCHRIYVSGGRVLYAKSRLPKAVEGDGIHTVTELVQQANDTEMAKAPWRRLKVFPADHEAQQCLAAAGLTLDSVPAQGQSAPLRRIEATAWGGVTQDHSETIHPDNQDIAIRAAWLFGLDSAGVDLISRDISVPWHQNGAIINEVNFAPLVGSNRNGYQLDGVLSKIIGHLVPQDGRVPVEVVIGSEGLACAAKRREVLQSRGKDTFLVSAEKVILPSGQCLQVTQSGLFARCRALLLNQRLQALVVVLQTDEFLVTGLPFDRVDRMQVVNDVLLDWRNPDQQADAKNVDRLLHWLSLYTVQ